MDHDNISDNNKPDSVRDKTKYTPMSIAFMEAESKYRHLPKENQRGENMSGGQEGDTVRSENESHNDETDNIGDMATSGVDPYNILHKKYSVPVLKSNQYQVRKSAARALMDVSLMMANISQLRTIIGLGEDKTEYFHLLLAFIGFSLLCQLVFAILMFVLLMKESEMAQKKDYLDNLQMLEDHGLSKKDSDVLKKKLANHEEDYRYNVYTSRLNYVTMFMVFIITVVNMLITGFGIRDT